MTKKTITLSRARTYRKCSRWLQESCNRIKRSHKSCSLSKLETHMRLPCANVNLQSPIDNVYMSIKQASEIGMQRCSCQTGFVNLNQVTVTPINLFYGLSTFVHLFEGFLIQIRPLNRNKEIKKKPYSTILLLKARVIESLK